MERENPFGLGLAAKCLLLSDNRDEMIEIAERRHKHVADSVRKAAYSTDSMDGLNFGRDATLLLGTMHTSILDTVQGFQLASTNTRILIVDGVVFGIIGENQPIPAAGNAQTFTLTNKKTGAIQVFTEEQINNDNPETETYLNRAIQRVVVGCSNKSFIESALETDSNTLEVASQGDTAAQVLATVNSACALLDLRQGSSLVLLVELSTCASLSTLTTTDGSIAFPNLHATLGGELSTGIRVIPIGPDQLPAEDSDGKFCMLFDADGFLVNKGGIFLDRSKAATIELSDSPDGEGAIVNMFQADGVALKITRTFSVEQIRTNVVQITGVNW